jgi:hypothetical protein
MATIGLQFVLGSGISSRFIAWYGNGYGGFSHVDGILSDGRLLGARSDKVGGQPAGVHIRPPGYEKWLKRTQVTFEVTAAVYKDWEANLRAKIGTPYDVTSIWGFVTGRQESTDGHWICSQLQLNALQHIKKVAFPLPMPAHQITPNTCLAIAAAIGGKVVVCPT